MTLNYYNNPFKYENLEDLNFDEFSIFEHLQYLGSYGITRLGIESVDIKGNDEKVLYKAQMAKQATALAPALKNDFGETIVSTSDASAENLRRHKRNCRSRKLCRDSLLRSLAPL